MINSNFFFVIIIFSVIGCSSIEKKTKGIYINSKNNHKIELLDSNKFIYTSYDGMNGKYYSYGNWELNNNKIILKNQIIEPFVEINYVQNNISTLKIVDYRKPEKQLPVKLKINNGITKISEIKYNDSLFSIMVLSSSDKILKNVKLKNDFYKVEILIAEKLNEVSIGTLDFIINNNSIEDRNKNKFKRK